jgi:hypothetical protein
MYFRKLVMKPEDAVEFRKMFTLSKPTKNGKCDCGLCRAHRDKETREKSATPSNPKLPKSAQRRVDGCGCSGPNKIQFTVDMSKCIWI